MTSIIGSDGLSTTSFEKYVYDDPTNKVLQATDVGYLRNDYSRLNVMGLLDKGDKEDFYKISVQTAGKLQLAYEADASIRIQVMDLYSRVIADSNSDMGAASEAYTAMEDGTYDAQAGTLILRITRQTPGDNSEIANYNIQAKMGEHEKDYVTWEASPPVEKPQPVMNPAVGFLSSFASAYSWLFK